MWTRKKKPNRWWCDTCPCADRERSNKLIGTSVLICRGMLYAWAQVNCRNEKFAHIMLATFASSCSWNKHFDELQRPQQRPKKINSIWIERVHGCQMVEKLVGNRDRRRMENWWAISRKSEPLFLCIEFVRMLSHFGRYSCVAGIRGRTQLLFLIVPF